MKVELLNEPDLEFGDCGTHPDIRFGLMRYGPLDYAQPSAPKTIRLGIVGSPQSVSGVCSWLEQCGRGIAAKPSRQPNLFPPFPGTGPEDGLRCSLVMSHELLREIPQSRITNLIGRAKGDDLVRAAVDLFLEEFQFLTEGSNADVFVCAWPLDLLNAIEPDGTKDEAEAVSRDEVREPADSTLDFHDLLKARAMSLRKPIQFVRPGTYDESARRSQKSRPGRLKQLQDPATRAWNIFTALYYKAGGIPWRLIRNPSEYATCYVGVSFYRTPSEALLRTSVAQVFNQRGEGVVLRGGKAALSDEDRQPHLTEEDARKLLMGALRVYRDTHRHLPARLALHKTSAFNDAELRGFTGGAEASGIELVDLVHVSESFTRLYRAGTYPPRRGTLLSVDDKTQILYTKGSVEFFATWPGLYVPMPRLLRYASSSQSPRALAQEILALTKMNWNNTQFDGSDPITVRAARQVSSILRFVPEGEWLDPRYSFYM